MSDLGIIQLVFSAVILLNLTVVIYLTEKGLKLLSQRMDNLQQCIKVLSASIDLLDERTRLRSGSSVSPHDDQK